MGALNDLSCSIIASTDALVSAIAVKGRVKHVVTRRPDRVSDACLKVVDVWVIF